MNTAILWTAGLVVSLTLHAGILIGLPRAFAPKPVEDQPMPRSEMRVETQAVARSESSAIPPPSDAAAAAPASGANLAQGAIPQSRATATALEPSPLAPAGPPPDTITASETPPTPAQSASLDLEPPLTAALPPGSPVAAATPLQAPTVAVIPPQETPVTAAPRPDSALAAAAPPTASVAVTRPETPAIAAAQPQAVPVTATLSAPTEVISTPAIAPVAAAAPVSEPVVQSRADAAILAAAAPEAQPLAQTSAPADALPEAPTQTTRITAELAFTGADDVALDPQALATIQSFMQPGDPGSTAAEARDALEALLSQVPCSRLQAEFDPDSGTIALRGHIPDEELRAPVLAALQAQVGQGIVVTDSMLILPRPQCGALAGIGAVGLPQSTDQVTNPRIVGNDAHARVFAYRDGDSLVLEMQAPDYDAYVYVDYYDAAGNVIHLVPNDIVPLTLHPAGSVMVVGRAADGQPALEITIAPPYGQEIAVAFAASVPLYDGLRPTVEDAGSYLAWLAERVAQARAADPGFKGEWVYFFVATRAD